MVFGQDFKYMKKVEFFHPLLGKTNLPKSFMTIEDLAYLSKFFKSRKISMRVIMSRFL